MAKRTLTITKFDGGLNCFSDARDIKDSEFFQNWNAVVDKAGIIRVSGEGHKYISNLPHAQAHEKNMQPGYGLHCFSSDYTYSKIRNSFDLGMESGTIAASVSASKNVLLATSPSNVTLSDYQTDNFFVNRTIFFYTGGKVDGTYIEVIPIASRHITDYTYDSSAGTYTAEMNIKITLPSNTRYKIYTWIADCYFGGDATYNDYAQISEGPYLTFANSVVNTSTDQINISSHNVNAPDAVRYKVGSDVINPLHSGTRYYADNVDDNNIKLYKEAEDAAQNASSTYHANNKIDITSAAGTGHKFYLNDSQNTTSFGNRPFISGPNMGIPAGSPLTTAALTNSATVLFIELGTAATNMLNTGDLFKLFKEDDSNTDNQEIMSITSITLNDTSTGTAYDKLTITRGVDDTRARPHSSGAKLLKIDSYGVGRDFYGSKYLASHSNVCFSGQGTPLGRITYGRSSDEVSEIFSDTSSNFSTGSKWDGGNGWTIADIGDGNGAGGFTYTHHASPADLIQTAANRTAFGQTTSINSKLLKLTYYVTAVKAGITTCRILGGSGEFAASNVNIPIKNGLLEVYFTSHSSANTANFKIDVASTSGGYFRILNMSLKVVENSGLTFAPGKTYNISFWCKTKALYTNAVSDTHIGDSATTTINTSFCDKLPHVLIYNDEVTNGNETGLYLQTLNNGPTWTSGQNGTYNFLDSPFNIQYIDNGDFSNGSISTDGSGVTTFTGTGVAWTAVNTGTAVTLDMFSDDNTAPATRFTGVGKSLKMTANTANGYTLDSAGNGKYIPSAYIYQDITLKPNTCYMFSFVYGGQKNGIAYSIEDRTDTGNIIYHTYGGDDTDPNKKFRVLGKTGLDEGDFIKYKYPSFNTTLNFSNEGKDEYSYIFFKTAENSGNDVTIRISFACGGTGDSSILGDADIFLDSVSLHKAWPDLITMSKTNQNYINPFEVSGGWNEYSLKLKVPEDYNESSAWTFALDGGMFTYKEGAGQTQQSVYFDDVRIWTEEPENMILLSDNNSLSSNMHLYSETSGEWTKNIIDWYGLNSQPVFTSVGGGVKISDGNFNNDNNNYNVYYEDSTLFGGFRKEGWVFTESAIPNPPTLRMKSSGIDAFITYKFNARSYIEKLFGDRTYRGAREQAYRRTNWEMDRLGSNGIVLAYVRRTGDEISGFSSRLSDNEGREYAQFSIASEDLSSSAPDGANQPRRNPFYFLVRGDDGTEESMKSKLMSQGYSGDLQIAKVEMDITYNLRAAQQSNNTASTGFWYNSPPPYFGVAVGPVTDVNDNGPDFPSTVYAGKEWTSENPDDIQHIVDCDVDSTSKIKVEADLIYDNELYEHGKYDTDNNKSWKRSSRFPRSQVVDEAGPKHIEASHTFTSVIDLTDLDNATSKDDLWFEFSVYHPYRTGAGSDYVESLGTNSTIINQLLRYRSYLFWHGEIKTNDFNATDNDGGYDTLEKHGHLWQGSENDGGVDGDGNALAGKRGPTGSDDAATVGSTDIIGKSVSEWSKRWNTIPRNKNISYGGTGDADLHFVPSNAWIVKANEYNDDYSDWDFSRWERLIFSRMQVYFYNENWTSTGSGQGSSHKSKTTLNVNFGTEDEIEPTGWARQTFTVAVTTVNQFGEESFLEISDFILGQDDAGEFTITEGAAPTINAFVGSEVLNNRNIKKLKYYFKNTNSDIWYLQFYIDLALNKIYSTTSNQVSSGTMQVNNQCMFYYINRKYMANFNEVDSYESETLVPSKIAEGNSNELICRYKTAVVVNDKLYVGNVKYGDRVYGDRMIKSPPNKFNILPSSNYIDVSINDGDEITALEYYKDKLLQFKKHKVFIIDVSGEFEFLVDTFDNVGITQQCQVARTKHGVAWANEDGCFLYDGKTLTNLISGKIPSTSDMASITNNYWEVSNSSTISESGIKTGSCSIQYIQSKDSLLVSRQTGWFLASSVPSAYEYNFPTKSWSFLSNKLTGTDTTVQGDMSNMAINKNGDIIYYSSHTTAMNHIFKWNDSASVNNAGGATTWSGFNFRTRDFDFGDAAVRKKIYKVYVTYKTDDGADSNISVYGSVNGSLDYDEVEFSTSSNFAGTTTNCYAANGATSTDTLVETDGVWKTAELKFNNPSQVSNIYSFQLTFYSNLKAAQSFEINDISIIYRIKNVK